MLEQDAFDLTEDQAKAATKRGWHWVIDHGRRFVTAKLLAAFVGGLGFVVAAQFFLPSLVATGCAVRRPRRVGRADPTSS